MPKTTSSINQDLEDLLATKGYDITPLDSSGKEVPVSSEAELLQFHFHRDGKDYGTVTATIDGLQKLTIYYDDEIADSGGNGASDERGTGDTSWLGLLKQIKKFAHQHQLGFVLKDTDRLRNDMKRRVHAKKLEEGKVKELTADLRDMTDDEFKKVYKMTKAEARAELKPKKDIEESSVDTMRRYYAGDTNARDRTKLSQMRDYFAQQDKSKPANTTTNKQSEDSINEISDKVVGDYYSKATKKHVDKVGMKRNMYDRIERDMGKARKKGIDRALDRLTKDKEEIKLDELDKKTLARYAKAAPKSADEIRKRASDFSRMGWDARGEGNTEEQSKWWGKAGDLVSKADRRIRGHERAVDRLVKENKKLDEGYYGNRKMSYSDDTPTVKMVIKHNRQLEETDQRFRHIEKIFLETSDGERFSVPTNKPSRARMFARHIAEGGAYRDERWSHLNEICEDLDKLGGFVRATHKKREQFNESAQRMIGEAQEQYIQLRETVKKLSGTKGYNRYFESYEPRVILEDDGDLSAAFMHSSIDARIESALPTLSKFGIKMGKINESDMFEEWANSIIDESLELHNPNQVDKLIKLLNGELSVGPNAEVALAGLEDIIDNEGLNNRLRMAAKSDSNSDAIPVIISWMQVQDNHIYRDVLEKIKKTDEPEEAPEQPAPQSEKGEKGGLPPLPPLAEGDDQLSIIKRLLRK
jgi:hypothetical protein